MALSSAMVPQSRFRLLSPDEYPSLVPTASYNYSSIYGTEVVEDATSGPSTGA
ncbi:UNVERIFIED_CONTAM: hypothetical protein Slati_2667800 [Sesamum latifolium]|uniref:Uncharacterized protein n=1 Tax=Sesamum latifolium TaxID=2727402 RepID=A0AAW2VZ69_9LAMI